MLSHIWYVQRKGTTTKRKYSETNFVEKKKEFWKNQEQNWRWMKYYHRSNPELGLNRDQVSFINWLDKGRTGFKKGRTCGIE